MEFHLLTYINVGKIVTHVRDCFFTNQYTEKNFDVWIAKLVRYNEQLIFAVILNARISHMNCLHKWY